MLANIAILAGITLLAAGAAYVLFGHRMNRTLSGRHGKAVSWLCRLALAAVFLVAAYGKLRDPYGFAASIYGYRLTPSAWAVCGALIMPLIETAASLALLFGPLWRGGCVVLGGLLAVFIAALSQAILRGIDIDCGCFGEGSSPVSFWLIARNYLLLLCAIFPLVFDRRDHRQPPDQSPATLLGHPDKLARPTSTGDSPLTSNRTT
ncbi:MAG: MauE/DoxX family redox-associated membrane protein [Candidatus Eisenbacteria bacterium]